MKIGDIAIEMHHRMAVYVRDAADAPMTIDVGLAGSAAEQTNSIALTANVSPITSTRL